MNDSTEHVTLLAGLITKVMDNYKRNTAIYNALQEIVHDVDLSDPMKFVPFRKYNEVCNYIQMKIGKNSLLMTGRTIGNNMYQFMSHVKLISDTPSPSEMVHALKKIALEGINDPLERGWEILEDEEKHILLRKTQTFNSHLQLGILKQLVSYTSAKLPKVIIHKSMEEDHSEYDEFKVMWI